MLIKHMLQLQYFSNHVVKFENNRITNEKVKHL